MLALLEIEQPVVAFDGLRMVVPSKGDFVGDTIGKRVTPPRIVAVVAVKATARGAVTGI